MSYYTPEPDEHATTLSLSPHPEQDSNHGAPLDRRMSIDAMPLYSPNQEIDPIDTIHSSESKEFKNSRMNVNNPDCPLERVPPIANDPQRALDVFNGNNILFRQYLDSSNYR